MYDTRLRLVHPRPRRKEGARERDRPGFMSHATGAQGGFGPVIAADASGNFAVAWLSNDQNGLGYGDVFLRRYTSAGTPSGTEFRVNRYTTSSQDQPSIGMDPGGNFVVVWDDDSGHDGSGFGVFGQWFDSMGGPVGTEFQVNGYTTRNQFSFHEGVAVAGNGDFLVVWEDGSHDGNLEGAFGQLFSSTGARLGTEFQVNTYTTNEQRFPVVAVQMTGNFVVVWSSVYQNGSEYGVFGQRFGPTNTPALTPTSTATSITATPTDTPTPASEVSCAATPIAGCRTPRRSTVTLRDRLLVSRNVLYWNWGHGARTDRVDFGDPLHTASYALCIYDSLSNTPQLVMTAVAPPGGTCVKSPCWKQTRLGFRYEDLNKSADGLLRIQLRGGADGKASITVRGRGTNLPLPTPVSTAQFLHDDSQVIVQLVKSDGGACWEARYPAPAVKNTTTTFKDRTP